MPIHEDEIVDTIRNILAFAKDSHVKFRLDWDSKEPEVVNIYCVPKQAVEYVVINLKAGNDSTEN